MPAGYWPRPPGYRSRTARPRRSRPMPFMAFFDGGLAGGGRHLLNGDLAALGHVGGVADVGVAGTVMVSPGTPCSVSSILATVTRSFFGMRADTHPPPTSGVDQFGQLRDEIRHIVSPFFVFLFLYGRGMPGPPVSWLPFSRFALQGGVLTPPRRAGAGRPTNPVYVICRSGFPPAGRRDAAPRLPCPKGGCRARAEGFLPPPLTSSILYKPPGSPSSAPVSPGIPSAQRRRGPALPARCRSPRHGARGLCIGLFCLVLHCISPLTFCSIVRRGDLTPPQWQVIAPALHRP